MRLINFEIVSSIEISVPGRWNCLDLHNCFDWKGIGYIVEAQHISMMWKRTSSDWVRSDLPQSLTMQFRSVSRFAAAPRDTDLPFAEDSCLSAVTFTPPEFAEDFEGIFEGYRSDSEHLTFAFMSKFALKIWAQEAELHIL